MRLAVTGGTGFIGGALCQALLRDGHEVLLLTRAPSKLLAAPAERMRVVPWQPGIDSGWMAQLDGVDGLINLAGESIAARRWTATQQRRILHSRLEVTTALVDAIGRMRGRPAVLISASAVGYYGPRGDEVLDESAPSGAGFLAEVCRQWEQAAARAETLGVSVVRLRLGLVLAKDGGALAKMTPPFRWGVGGPLGSGRQWMSWVHRDDVIGVLRWALAHPELAGAVNATAPSPATMRDFARTLGRVLHRPALLPAPAFALRLLLGAMASELLLSGQRVIPVAAQRAGYVFVYPSLEDALRACV